MHPISSPWRSRGYLPHFERADAIQAITFRLADSLPLSLMKSLDAALERTQPEFRNLERRKRLDYYLDSGHGSCILADPRAAQVVQEALLHFDAERYRLLAWVIMPNHVHVLIEILQGSSLGKLVQSWKSFTASWIRKNEETLVKRPVERDRDAAPQGVWQREYWDRFIRDNDHYGRVVEYIRQNPVKAGLVDSAENWPWSSARLWCEGQE